MDEPGADQPVASGAYPEPVGTPYSALRAPRALFDTQKGTARSWNERHRRRPGRLAVDVELRAAVQEKLQLEWSPEQISAWLRSAFAERPSWHVCHETIYQALYSGSRGGLRQDLDQAAAHRAADTQTTAPSPRAPAALHGARAPDRPAPAGGRVKVPLGDWEGDLIAGRNNQSAIGTLVDRRSRYVVLVHLPAGRSADALRDAIAIARLPQCALRSLTWDQGSEMARHDEIGRLFADGVFFAYPGRPWERGSKENANGLLRQYFPKRSDLTIHTPTDLAAVADRLNNRPRKTLGWMTPAQVFAAALGS